MSERVRRIYDFAHQQLLDSKEIYLMFDPLPPDLVYELIKTLEQDYQRMGGQELLCSTGPKGMLILKPHDVPS